MVSQPNTVKVYQVYFKEEQKTKLEPEYIPYYNYPTTVFFESKIMCDLIDKKAHKNCMYFGVVSHNLRAKVKEAKMWGRTIRNKSLRYFSAKQFEQFVRVNKPDIASYTTHQPHKVFPIAEKFHRGIALATVRLLEKMKFKGYWDDMSEKVIYFNYFVARPEIYEDYIQTMLKPAIKLMREDPQIKKLVDVNSHYKKPMTDELSKQIGYNYWPLHPFICERLINLYILHRNLTFIQW